MKPGNRQQTRTVGRRQGSGPCWLRGRVTALLLLGLVIAMGGGCTRIHTEKGIDPRWHGLDPDTFETGVSRQSDVMTLLGPPSQIISHQQGVIFYYLHEEAVGTGAIFILYNQGVLNTRYDRAIFFFDASGVLQDFAFTPPPGQEG